MVKRKLQIVDRKRGNRVKKICMGKKSGKKEEIVVNANAVKCNESFVTRKKLKRTPASENNRKMAIFIDSHNFSFDIDAKTGKLKSRIAKNKVLNNK